MHARILATLLAAFALLAAPRPAPAQTLLRLKFTPGEVVRTKITTEMNSEATVQGKPFATTMNQTMHMEMHVDSIAPDGTATVRQEITRIQMSMTMPVPINQTFSYDSAAERNESAPQGYSEIFDAIVGAEYHMKVSSNGTMSDVVVPMSLLESLQKVPGAAAMDSMLSEEGMRKMVTQSSFGLPDAPVQKGDTWKRAFSMDLPFATMKADQIYTYDGRNAQGLEVIGLKFDMALETKPGQALQITMKDAKSSGVMLYDPKLGRIVHAEHMQDMTMPTTVNGQQSFEQKLRQKLTMDVEASK